VQPGRDGGVAAETVRAPEGRDHGVLQRVRRLLGVGQGADRYGPEPIPVPEEELAEGVGITRDMAAEQFIVAQAAA
jgi:hypothetical protein